MTDFKVGDKVVIVKNFDSWCDGEFPESTVLTIVENDNDNDEYIDRDALTIEFDGVYYNKSDFALVDAPFGGFVSANTTGVIGEAGSETIVPLDLNTLPTGTITLEQTVRTDLNDLTVPNGLPTDMFDKYRDIIEKAQQTKEPGILGVFRPNLEDRKVGKVRVELVDDGFPLALREIAKVMTWAQTAKGYKDHDWQNLPNPEQALSAATSRHRTDNIIQRQVGKVAAIECTDHESNILHKAHEAFGVLAQLELILRGVIK